VSRLFAITKGLDKIVVHFAVDMTPAIAVPSVTVVDAAGLIVLENDGMRLLRSIPWGRDRPQFRRMHRSMRDRGRLDLDFGGALTYQATRVIVTAAGDTLHVTPLSVVLRSSMGR
jgi:hypothetical protein